MNDIKQPIRVQRKRTKGFKLPPNTKCVNRGTQWGNPFRVEYLSNGLWGVKTSVEAYFEILTTNCHAAYKSQRRATEDAIKCYKILVEGNILIKNDIVVALQGYNLACFCPISSPCHADILLKIANE
jgi:hypothetical protein